MSMARATQIVHEGIAAAKAGELLRARQLFGQAIEVAPENVAAWVWSAGVAESPGQAVRALERALQLDPENQAAQAAIRVGRFEAGVAAARANRRSEASDWLRQVCADDPNNEAAWLWRAGSSDDPEESIRCLERALELNPANERARAGIAHFRARVVSRWCCPICDARAEGVQTTCPSCRAILDLALGDAAIGNTCPDVEKIQAGVDRLSAEARSKREFGNRYYLGMALLNLGKPEEAVRYLRARPGS